MQVGLFSICTLAGWVSYNNHLMFGYIFLSREKEENESTYTDFEIVPEINNMLTPIG